MKQIFYTDQTPSREVEDTMRVPIITTNESVEIGQYREVNKGSLKAFFTIVEYPSGRKTTDFRHFVKGTEHWFSFPQREYKKPGSDKTEYFPYISYLNKEYYEHFKKAVITALKEQGNNGQANTYQKQENPLQDDASTLWL